MGNITFEVVRSEPQLWTVGHYDSCGAWQSHCDYATRGEAQSDADRLNGVPLSKDDYIEQLHAQRDELVAAFDDRVRVIEMQLADKAALVAALRAVDRHILAGAPGLARDAIRAALAKVGQ